jgi:hypothetical protein
MIYGAILAFILLISLAYVVLVLANKEEGNMKMLGQLISAVIALIAVIALLYGALGYGCPMKAMMGSQCGCMMEGKKGCATMDMMQDKGMKDKMQKKMKTMMK